MVFKRLVETTAVYLSLLMLTSIHANADTLSVPGAYPSVSAAVSAAQDGDIIEIEAGTYSGAGIVATLGKDNLTLRGVNGMAHLNASGVTISNRKAIFVTTADNITLENIEFSNAVVPDHNGAGIRHEGGLLTVRNCYFHDNEMGILTSNHGYGELFVEHTEFDHNGLGRAGYTHNIYVGHIAKFTLQYSYSHHATHGHNVKSRAAENFILYNRIMDETTGNSSYQIDIPNGGLTYIIGNTIHQGTRAENSRMISYAAEGLHADNPVQEIYVSANTLVNDRSSGRGIRLVHNPTAVIINNIFDNISTGYAVEGTTTVYENNRVGTDNDFADRDNYDFHLTADSPAIGQAGSPGSYRGVDLTPLDEYVHPLDRKERATDSQLDIGAFEFSDESNDDADSGDADSDDADNDSSDNDSDSSVGNETPSVNNSGGGSGGGCFIRSISH